MPLTVYIWKKKRQRLTRNAVKIKIKKESKNTKIYTKILDCYSLLFLFDGWKFKSIINMDNSYLIFILLWHMKK